MERGVELVVFLYARQAAARAFFALRIFFLEASASFSAASLFLAFTHLRDSVSSVGVVTAAVSVMVMVALHFFSSPL